MLPTPNDDEITHPYIGNFHKTLPHDDYGEVIPADYQNFVAICENAAADSPADFELVASGGAPVAKLVNPLAGVATESLGPDPRSLSMLPAPKIASLSTAAEMTELYWMALLRDVDLATFATDPRIAAAVAELTKCFGTALAGDHQVGALRLGLDLPRGKGQLLDISAQTLFRCGLPGESRGPLISQFFLQTIPFGTQFIDQRQYPYAAKRDFLITYTDWIRAQRTGLDGFGRDYGSCNNWQDDTNYFEPNPRFIATIRDLARFVNRDALHQAYFNAALLLSVLGAPLDPGNPYVSLGRQIGFGTLGGPDLLTLVSEVASRALKVVWRQKWLIHRRARPEAYGGLLEMMRFGPGAPAPTKNYPLPSCVMQSSAYAQVLANNQTVFLPMAFSAGSPTHPSYGAGHATVAGACVTVLKAWFDEAASLTELFAAYKPRDPGPTLQQVSPGLAGPTPYAGKLSVEGELNKLASNVAMGRSMGGVHWRSDNTRSLRLGEAIAVEILRKRTLEYAESASFSLRSFDGRRISIGGGVVTVRP